LDDSDRLLRDAAAYLLAAIDGPTAKLADAVWRRFEKENHESVQASLILAFGILASHNESNVSVLLALLVNARSKSVELATAMSLVRLSPAEPCRESLFIMLEAAQSHDGYQALADSIWGKMDGLELLLMNHLTCLKGNAAQVVENTLMSSLPSHPHSQALRIAEILLNIAFDASLWRDTTFASLSEQQQRVLRLLANSRNIWTVQIGGSTENQSIKASMLMRSCGLPDHQSRLLSFIQGGPKVPN
jgi:hypothetical protein